MSEEYRAALDFFKQFEKKPDVKYDWVLAYAKDLHERCGNTDKLLDDKADSIIKYLGGGSALLIFGALMSIKPEKPETCLLGLVALVSLIPSLLFAVLAMRAALRVRRPQSAATPPSVTKAIHLAESYATSEEAELNLILIYHPICEAYVHRNAVKAKHLQYAHKFYDRSLLWVFLPVVVICIVLAVQAFKPSSTPPATSSADHLYRPDALHAGV